MGAYFILQALNLLGHFLRMLHVTPKALLSAFVLQTGILLPRAVNIQRVFQLLQRGLLCEQLLLVLIKFDHAHACFLHLYRKIIL